MQKKGPDVLTTTAACDAIKQHFFDVFCLFTGRLTVFAVQSMPLLNVNIQ